MRVGIASDEAYPVYYFEAKRLDSPFMGYVEVDEADVDRWQSIEDTYAAYQEELAALISGKPSGG